MLLHRIWIFPRSILIYNKLTKTLRQETALNLNYMTKELIQNSRCIRFNVIDVLKFKILQFNIDKPLNV